MNNTFFKDALGSERRLISLEKKRSQLLEHLRLSDVSDAEKKQKIDRYWQLRGNESRLKEAVSQQSLLFERLERRISTESLQISQLKISKSQAIQIELDKKQNSKVSEF